MRFSQVALTKIWTESTHRWGKDHCTAGLQFNKTGTDHKRTYILFLCSEPVEYKLVKLETSCTVILPPTVSLLWFGRAVWGNTSKGESPGLVVMGGDFRSEECGFESQCHILDGHFFTLICCKIVLIIVWKRPKINEKRPGMDHF